MFDKIINLCPHALNVYAGADTARNGNKLMLLGHPLPKLSMPTLGVPVRVAYDTDLLYDIDGVPVFQNNINKIVGLPESDGSLFVMSARSAQSAWLAGRRDVATPTGHVTSGGAVIGCTGLLLGGGI